MSDILVLSAADVKKLVDMRAIIGAVEDAFRAYGKGTSKLAPITLCLIDKYEGELEIKSGYVDEFCSATKILLYYKDNPSKHGIPALSGTIVLNDIHNGKPFAVLDGAYITANRTGAAGAVAAKYLARPDSETVGVIGAGVQGRAQVRALNELFKIKTVKVYDIDNRRVNDYVKEMSAQYPFRIEKAESPAEAVMNADIVLTVTTSTKPIVQNQWIHEGMHINAIGADAPGKQELDAAIIPRTKLVVDSVAQCVERGEIQTAIRQGLLKKENIYAELSDIVLGGKPGRENPREITMFDATGMIVQDITTAYAVYQLAKKQGLGTSAQIT